MVRWGWLLALGAIGCTNVTSVPEPEIPDGAYRIEASEKSRLRAAQWAQFDGVDAGMWVVFGDDGTFVLGALGAELEGTYEREGDLATLIAEGLPPVEASVNEADRTVDFREEP